MTAKKLSKTQAAPYLRLVRPEEEKAMPLPTEPKPTLRSKSRLVQDMLRFCEDLDRAIDSIKAS